MGHLVGAFTTGAKPARKDSLDSETAIMLKNAVRGAEIQSQKPEKKASMTKFMRQDDDDLLEDLHSMSPRRHP